jgi:hypothetical protein
MTGKKVVWPSVEDQLAAHKIVRDSALEKLVRENQDFGMLRPEEAHDNLEIPPWLRVYWRKQHPGSKHAAGDPTGGYPRVLHTILLVMLANQDNPAGSAPQAAPPGPAQKKHGGRR